MAEPAYEQLEEYEVPAGGIADFIVPDEEIEAMDRRDAERAFGNAGIANFKDVAARMADYGRYGDDTVAHLQTGEIVIPAALIADNPALKESIFDDLRARGIEDPERYVVGSPENSINPDTGLPEFFLKKLFKGVKKAFKKVGKFLKKAAGVILPVALSFTPLGPVFGAALGSGIASLIQGGNLKDAFKAAAIAGATGGILKGVSSVAQGGTFMGGIREAVQVGPFAPAAAPGAAGAGVPVVDAVPSVAGGELTAKGLQEAAAAKAGAAAASLPPVVDATPAIVGGAAPGAAAGAATGAAGAAPGAINIGAGQPFAPLSASQALSASTPAAAITAQPTGIQAALGATTPYAGPAMPIGLNELVGQAPSALETALTAAPTAGAAGLPGATTAGASGLASAAGAPLPRVAPATAQTQQSFARKYLPESVTDFYDQYLSPSRGIPKEGITQTQAYKDLVADGISGDKAFDMVMRQVTGGPVRQYGPLAALGAAGLYAGGFFETPEQEELTIGYPYTGFDLLAQNPEYYGLSGGYTPPVYTPPPNIPDMTAAKGGEVYPRRNGGIMPYEGTPDEDSVRALLMPGEFVMTKDAVRGLGNGSVDRGIKNMYSVMRDLERRGRVA